MLKTIKSLQHEALTQLLDAFQHSVDDHYRVPRCPIPKLLHEVIKHGVVSFYCVISFRHDISAEPDPWKTRQCELNEGRTLPVDSQKFLLLE
jgi:hypothetical protein